MKHVLGSFLACLGLAFGLQAHSTTLPDACGNDNTQFEVKAEKNQPAPALPAEGKAQLVFIEQVDASAGGFCFGCNSFTTRFGVDGAWAGAAKGGSYFTLDVAPGEHHLCAYWKGIQAARSKNIDVASVNTEAGKVYYFQSTIVERAGAVTGTSNGTVSSQLVWVLKLSQLSEDEGKYHVKTSALAVSRPKK